MKKASKILLFTLIGTVVAVLVAFFVMAGSNSITHLGIALETVSRGFFDLKSRPTYSVLVGGFAVLFIGLGILYAIQVRRKKTKSFIVNASLLLIGVFVTIVALLGKSIMVKEVGRTLPLNEKLVILVGGILIGGQLFAKAVLSVAFTFENSDLAANAKKSDKTKIMDIVLATVLAILFIPVLFFISGGSFSVIPYFFTKSLAGKNGPLAIIVVVIEVILAGFVLYKLIKGRKSFVGPLYVLFAQFVIYTFSFYASNSEVVNGTVRHSRLETGFNSYLSSGEILKILIVIGIVVYLLLTVAYALYMLADTVIIFFENKRQKLYNHREKYVYGDRRRFGDSIVKEWENSKNQQYAQSFSQQLPAGLQEFEEIVETNQNVDLNDLGIDNDALIAEQDTAEDISVNDTLADDVEDSKKVARVTTLEFTEEAAAQDFRIKLLMLEPEKQARYNAIRNKLQSFKKIKQKFSKTVDSYRYAGELVAKVSVLGSTLRLHLALDPDSYDVEKYHHVDLSSKSKYIFVPFTLKLKGPKSVELALQLIDELMAGFDIPQNANYKEVDYVAEVQKEVEAEQGK